MRLRLILLVLAFLAFLSTSLGGYLYYANLHASAFKEAERQAKMRLEILSKSVTSYLAENNKVVRILAGQAILADHLRAATNASALAVNAILDQFQAEPRGGCLLSHQP